MHWRFPCPPILSVHCPSCTVIELLCLPARQGERVGNAQHTWWLPNIAPYTSVLLGAPLNSQ